ncbi:MAG: P-loop NTPase [Deltaproteobacteria bacterium]|nr:P-loop NTPase [Deltaproteobacteria bacterium]
MHDSASAMYPAPGPGLPRFLMERQVHVVMGKGGVGKSMVSLALALGLAARGRRVLLCQVNTADAHGPLLGVPVGKDLVEVQPRLSCVDMEPLTARREYVMMILKFRAVYDALFENRFAQYFMRFVPSLAELNMTGKVWFHAEEKDGKERRWDHVIVDAPATGHGITLVKVPRVISSTAPSGPLKQQTAQMAALFEDAQRTALHVVTTPDELSVLETEELVARLRNEKVGPLGVAVLNRVPPRLFDGVDHAPLTRVTTVPGVGPYAAAALERARLELATLAARDRLTALGLPVLALPETPGQEFLLDDAKAMAATLFPPPRVVEAL